MNRVPPTRNKPDASATAATTATMTATHAATSSMKNDPQMIDVSSMTRDIAVTELIDHAVNMNASDLFFVSNEQHLAVLVRHLGVVRPISVLATDQGRRCLSHINANS